MAKCIRLALFLKLSLFSTISMLMLGFTQSPDSRNQAMFMNSNHEFAVNFQDPYFSSTEFCSPLIGTILKQHFRPAPYPSTYPFNPFCPFCLKYIRQQQAFMVYRQPLFAKSYLAHSHCLQLEENTCLNTLLQETSQARVTFANETNFKRLISYDEVDYYIEMELSHSLTSKKYFTLRNRLLSVDNTHIIWDLHSSKASTGSMPNIIAFPFPDFDLSLSYTKMTERHSQYSTKAHVNLQNIKTDTDSLIKITTDDVQLIARVIHCQAAKKQLIQEMNYKYRYSLDMKYPLIQLLMLQVKLKSAQQAEDDDYICSNQNSCITELLNQNSSCYSSYQSTYPYKKTDKKIALIEASNQPFLKEQISLTWLVSSGKLPEYVRNSTQSRNFQASLNDFNEDDLENIVQALSGDFRQLVTHEYANYMMQKLFARCNSKQRLLILRQLLADIPIIALSTQGTHTLQSFIPFLVEDQQRQVIIERIRPNIAQMALHSNATHFLQKIISSFSLGSILPFYAIATKRFVQFSLDKNAMCVLKQLMKKISDSTPSNLAKQLQKGFVNPLLLNLDRIIQDAFGNYVVQFSFEFFGENTCAGVTEIIIQRFEQYSIQKYSGSVVNKCVDTYWNCLGISERLKLVLSNEAVYTLYRNKDGNKILLTLMEKCQGTALRERISAQLMMLQPSKFQHDRWALVLGSRSWTTGTQYGSFTEAMKPRQKKKKTSHNIQ